MGIASHAKEILPVGRDGKSPESRKNPKPEKYSKLPQNPPPSTARFSNLVLVMGTLPPPNAKAKSPRATLNREIPKWRARSAAATGSAPSGAVDKIRT